MFNYKVFYKDPNAVGGVGCVLIQEISWKAALRFFNREYPGYVATTVCPTFELPL